MIFSAIDWVLFVAPSSIFSTMQPICPVHSVVELLAFQLIFTHVSTRSAQLRKSSHANMRSASTTIILCQLKCSDRKWKGLPGEPMECTNQSPRVGLWIFKKWDTSNLVACTAVVLSRHHLISSAYCFSYPNTRIMRPRLDFLLLYYCSVLESMTWRSSMAEHVSSNVNLFVPVQFPQLGDIPSDLSSGQIPVPNSI